MIIQTVWFFVFWTLVAVAAIYGLQYFGVPATVSIWISLPTVLLLIVITYGLAALRYRSRHLATQLIIAETWDRWAGILEDNSQHLILLEQLKPWGPVSEDAIDVIRTVAKLVGESSPREILLSPTGQLQLRAALGYEPSLPISEIGGLGGSREKVRRIVKPLMQKLQEGNYQSARSDLEQLRKLLDESNQNRDFELSSLILMWFSGLLPQFGSLDDLRGAETAAKDLLRLSEQPNIDLVPNDYIKVKINLAQAIASQGSYPGEGFERLEEALSHLDDAKKKASSVADSELLATTALAAGKLALDAPLKSPYSISYAIENANIAAKENGVVSFGDEPLPIRMIALMLRGSAYVQLRQIAGQDTRQNSELAVEAFQEAYESLPENEAFAYEAIGQFAVALISHSKWEPTVLDHAINLLSELDQRRADPMHDLLITHLVANAMFARRHFEYAESYLEKFFEMADSELVKESADRLEILPWLHNKTDQLAHIYIAKSELSGAIECLEVGRSRFFKRVLPNKLDIDASISSVLRSGVTPIYLTYTSMGIDAVAIRPDEGSSTKPYDAVTIDYTGIQVQEILHELELGVQNPWEALASVESLLAPIKRFLLDEKIDRAVFLTGGPLARLPLHVPLLGVAAISYIPALCYVSQRGHRPSDSSKLESLLVGTSAPDIPIAQKEVKQLESILPGRRIAYPAGDVLSSEFLNHLSEIRYAHLSCHGVFTPTSPMDSYLELANGESLTMSDVLNHSGKAADSTCEHVMLSTCESSAPDLLWLATEGASLSLATLVATQARAVVGSMWKSQAVASYIFVVFYYKRLITLGGTAQSAQALHDTQLWIKSIPADQLLMEIQNQTGMIEDLSDEFLDLVRKSGKELLFEKYPQTWSSFVLTGIPEI